MNNLIVIHELDKEDNDRCVIGVASSRDKALEIINEYYGKEHIMTNFKDIREDNVDFSCKIEVAGSFGGFYSLWGEIFVIDRV